MSSVYSNPVAAWQETVKKKKRFISEERNNFQTSSARTEICQQDRQAELNRQLVLTKGLAELTVT